MMLLPGTYVPISFLYLFRNLGMGVSSIGARVGGIMAPLVLLLVRRGIVHVMGTCTCMLYCRF